jgi:hypothetical protein
MSHLREAMPYSIYPYKEKALMDISRALIKRRCEEARLNAESTRKIDIREY